MGNNHSGHIKDIQELVDAVRSKQGAHSEKEALQTINLRMETATIRHNAKIIQDLKLKPISEIIKSDDVSAFQEVIEEGNLNNFERIGSLQLTPLHLAAYHNSPNILNHLLQDPKVLTNVPNNDGDTPLNLALFGAADDASAMALLRIFQTRPDLSILLKNAQHKFPLLITTQRKFSGASKLLLEVSAGPSPIAKPKAKPIRKKYIIDEYEIWDLVHVIKLALITNQKDLANLIHQNLGPPRRIAILDDIMSTLDAELFADVVNLLSQDLAASVSVIVEDRFQTSETVKPLHRSKSKVEAPTEKTAKATTKKEVETTKTNTETAADKAKSSSKSSKVLDAAGHILQVGNIVRMLSAQFVKKALPSTTRPADVEKVAGKLALVHGIYGDKIYVEIHREHFVARINSEATVFENEGTTITISDGGVGRIGSYVKISSDVSDEAGWIHGMKDALGKTGKIVRFLRNSDVLVQFAWGPRYFFKPTHLIQSSSDELDTQDSKGNWIRPGSLLQITKFPAEFVEIQKKNKLKFEGDYAHLPWKYATVRSIQLTAFADGKMLQILYRNKPYFVHVDSVELIDSAQDRNNQDVRVGALVQVIKDAEEFKLVLAAQIGNNSGDFEEMSKVMGEVGMVTALFNDENKVVPSNTDNDKTWTCLMIKVEFCYSGGTKTLVDLHPRLTEIFTGTVVPVPIPIRRGDGPNYVTGQEAEETDSGTFVRKQTTDVIKIKSGEEESKEGNHVLIDENNWEEIPRESLKCLEELGQGAYGCVVRGEWTRSGSRDKKIVAIKQVHFGLTNKAGPLIEVMAEAKIQFTLRHPNIVSLFGTSLGLDQDLWIVMDYVDGTDLYTYLDPHDGSDTIFSDDQKIQLCLDMTSAIAYIHLKGYIHSDIKPMNMMVDRSGKLSVCDFGIAEFCGEKQDFVTFATEYANDFCGTLYYIPPECLQPNELTGKFRKPTFAADVWALGAVFYELFTRLHLYDNHMKFMNDKVAQNDTLVKRRMGDVPPNVRSIVGKALDFNRHSRPSAQQLFEFFHELKI